MASRIVGQLTQRIDTIVQKVNAASPEAYASVADDLKGLRAQIEQLDGRRITGRLNDPSAGGKPARKAAKKTGKKSAKRGSLR